MDGLLGLGRVENVASGNPTGIEAPSLLDELITQKIISTKLFGLRLSRTSDNLTDGEVNFGAPDTDAYDGDLNYITTMKNANGFWELPLDSVSVGGKETDLSGARSAILDSGTSFIMIALTDAVAIHGNIPGAIQNGNAFLVPCDTTAPVTLGFGGKTYDMSHKDYVGRPVASNNGSCSSLIVGRTLFGDSQWLVGAPFLKNVYSVYDFGGNRMGLAPLKAIAGSQGASNTISSAGPATSTSGTTSQMESSPSTTEAISNSVPESTGSPISSSGNQYVFPTGSVSSSSSSAGGTSVTKSGTTATPGMPPFLTCCHAFIYFFLFVSIISNSYSIRVSVSS
jgi:hypothetical protein